MRYLELALRYLLFEPLTWIFYCFFQPARFASEFEIKSLSGRVRPMLRLALPTFLVSYPLALLVQAILSSYFSSEGFLGSYPNVTSFLSATAWATALSIGWGTLAGMAGDIRLGIVLELALGITGSLIGNTQLGIVGGITVAIALGLVGGVAGGDTWGIPGGFIGAIVAGTAWSIAGGTRSFSGGIEVAMTFIVTYIVGYYRLPLYPVSSLSGLRARYACQKKPDRVFTHLQKSSLYWDEHVFLPLPGLRRTLLTAVGQNPELARKEIAFIVAQRPQQVGAAQIALLEIAVHELEARNSLRDIAQASYRLEQILSQEVRQIVPQWMTSFARLSDASRDAARYCSPLDRRTRRRALEDMIANLSSINLNINFGDARLNKRLRDVVAKWLAMAQQEQNSLTQAPLEIGQIDNPFSPGEVLKQSDTLFVGRRDLVQLLENSLSKKNGRPTFFLTGERRMGKTSTLKQLPKLLGSRYLPITFDLQAPGICSSTTAFLYTIAEEMFKVMQIRGMQVKKLDPALLQTAANEAAIYLSFDRWLKDMELALAQQDYTLLLALDEFEKLEEAGQAGYLNLGLLLDWCRSVIQNRPRLALLFSGVRGVSEMGSETDINWAHYFVNVQTLKASFLKPAEAHKLITEPQADFPSEKIFGQGVAEEIIKVTGCHPFLIQAICSALIDHLNTNERDQAASEDVKVAMHQVLESWWDTYFRDLWQRTELDQRTCLIALRSLDKGNLQDIARQSSLDEQTVQQTLQTLLKRDLVLYVDGNYQIAAPIFSEWVERNR